MAKPLRTMETWKIPMPGPCNSYIPTEQVMNTDILITAQSHTDEYCCSFTTNKSWLKVWMENASVEGGD